MGPKSVVFFIGLIRLVGLKLWQARVASVPMLGAFFVIFLFFLRFLKRWVKNRTAGQVAAPSAAAAVSRAPLGESLTARQPPSSFLSLLQNC